jgi:hypothetical protein
MKLNGQSRSFVKQVQVDLLALCDADLLHTVHQWIDESDSSEVAFEVPEDTRLALGYSRVLPDTEPLSHHHADMPGVGREGPARWLAPSPQHLRALIMAMDVHVFAEQVITFAFKSLHSTHPEWYDGVTFNAHLANYLRRIRDETAKQRTTQKYVSKLRNGHL